MSFNPVFQTDNYKKQSIVKSAQSIVECRFSQTDDVGEIIAVYPQVSTSSCEVSSGRINYGGRLVCTLVYVDDTGKFCRVQKGAEFSHFVDDDSFAPIQTAICNLKCDKVNIRRDGSSIVISAVTCANLMVFTNAERNALSTAEGVICKTENVTFLSAVTFFGESEVEDEFEADNVADVLIPAANAHICRAECASGEILIEGEMYLSVLAIRKEAPISFEKTVPFKAVVPCENSYLTQNAACFAEVKDLSVTASVNEDAGRCEVSVVAALGFSGVFYEEKEVPVAVDAFSCESNLTVDFNQESAYKIDAIKTYTERVMGLCASKSKLDYTCSFKATALPSAEYFYNKDTGMIEGAVTSLLIYEQNGEDRSTEITLPFALSLGNLGMATEDKVEISLAVSGVSVRRKSENECEAEALLKIYACILKSKTSRYICQLTLGEALNINDSAISVFIPAAGEELWDVAKRLKKTPKDVTSCNPELSFPLTGKERIIIYRPKNA